MNCCHLLRFSVFWGWIALPCIPLKTQASKSQIASRRTTSHQVVPVHTCYSPMICFHQINVDVVAFVLKLGTMQPAVVKHYHERMLPYFIVYGHIWVSKSVKKHMKVHEREGLIIPSVLLSKSQIP